MTAPTAQNTVFLVANEVEPIVKARCDKGQSLFRKWFDKYNIVVKQSNDLWQVVMFGKDFIPYLNHCNNCDQCTEYEYSLRGRGLEKK